MRVYHIVGNSMCIFSIFEFLVADMRIRKFVRPGNRYR